ncbi:MAG: STAS domain-containing protein [Candidatus Riflebacteria bacterium]|nr:STAS domain-containing protein [Candidatus Riflebacteria bacterium]
MEYSFKKIEDPSSKTGDSWKLEFTGELVLSQANEIKKILLEALGKYENLVIDLSQVSALDVSFLQLLCSMHKSAIKAGKIVKLDSKMSQIVREVISLAGFERTTGCSRETGDTCMWIIG